MSEPGAPTDDPASTPASEEVTAAPISAEQELEGGRGPATSPDLDPIADDRQT